MMGWISVVMAFVRGNPRLIGAGLLALVVAAGWARFSFVKHQRDAARQELSAAETDLGNLCADLIDGWGGDRTDDRWPRYRAPDVSKCTSALHLLIAERTQLMATNGALNGSINELQAEIGRWAQEYGLSQDRVSQYERSVRHLASELAAAAAREAKLSDLLERTEESTAWADAVVRGPDVAERLRALARQAAGTRGTDRADANHPSPDAGPPEGGPAIAGGGVRLAAAGRADRADEP